MLPHQSVTGPRQAPVKKDTCHQSRSFRGWNRGNLLSCLDVILEERGWFACANQRFCSQYNPKILNKTFLHLRKFHFAKHKFVSCKCAFMGLRITLQWFVCCLRSSWRKIRPSDVLRDCKKPDQSSTTINLRTFFNSPFSGSISKISALCLCEKAIFFECYTDWVGVSEFPCGILWRKAKVFNPNDWSLGSQ